MSQHTQIVHGHSDCSESFIELKERLNEEQIGSVDTIIYADYESREDNITFNDVIDGLNDQMIDIGIYYDLISLQNAVIYQTEPAKDKSTTLFIDNKTTLIEYKIDRNTSYVSLYKEPKK